VRGARCAANLHSSRAARRRSTNPILERPLPDQPLVVLGRVDVGEGAGVVDRHVNDRRLMGPDDRLRSHRLVGAA